MDQIPFRLWAALCAIHPYCYIVMETEANSLGHNHRQQAAAYWLRVFSLIQLFVYVTNDRRFCVCAVCTIKRMSTIIVICVDPTQTGGVDFNNIHLRDCTSYIETINPALFFMNVFVCPCV